MLKVTLTMMVCGLLSACSNPTKFTGEAKFPSGTVGCENTCRADGMVMTGFVYSGEFATSCVCGPAPGAATASSVNDASAAPNAGVVAQAQAAAAAAANASSQRMMIQQQQRR